MMITNNKKPSWFFYLAWVTLSSISIPISFAIYLAIRDELKVLHRLHRQL